MVIKHLIGKLSDMVKMGREGLVVATLINLSGYLENLLHKEDLVETQLLRTVAVEFLGSKKSWKGTILIMKVSKISFHCKKQLLLAVQSFILYLIVLLRGGER